jgi:hypothetical protein
MSSMASRLDLCEAVLALIEKKRLETGDARLGAAIESFIIESEFRGVEGEILEDPGAIEPWLVRRRGQN